MVFERSFWEAGDLGISVGVGEGKWVLGLGVEESVRVGTNVQIRTSAYVVHI